VARNPNNLKKGTSVRNKGAAVRAREERVLDAYVEQAPWVGGDPERDKQAMITAVDRAGPVRLTRDETKLSYFRRLWKSDEAREYMRASWAFEIEEAPDPVSLVMRTVFEHMTQPVTTCGACAGEGIKEVRDGESFVACPACQGTGKRSDWGPRDRGTSMAATNAAIKMFIPTQTSVSKNLNLSAKIERPEQFDQEPTMRSRTILPAGQKITKPSAPTGADDDDEESDDDDE
jgi:hypothetical protein